MKFEPKTLFRFACFRSNYTRYFAFIKFRFLFETFHKRLANPPQLPFGKCKLNHFVTQSSLRRPVILTLTIFFLGCQEQQAPELQQVRTGLDRLASGETQILNGLRVGIITNQTGIASDGKHVADIVAENPNIKLAALFGPEHGIRGQMEGGYSVSIDTDPKTGAPIYSLYGKTRKPTSQMLAGLDALVFDIQDIGARFYTYISTMSHAMEAAAEHGLKFLVLDRPNPIGGEWVEGPVLDPEHRSFIGVHPIPLRHGMTVGELAKMFNEEGWLANGVKADLHVVNCEGWRREQIFSDFSENWTPPSPNVPNLDAALLYPGVGLVETLPNFSEGRGTETPFEVVGAPWLNADAVIAELEQAGLEGVAFEKTTFTPKDMPGKATNNKHDGQMCQGVKFKVSDGRKLESVKLGFALLVALQKIHANELEMNERRVTRFTGQTNIFSMIKSGASLDELEEFWRPELEAFIEKRKNYLLY